MTVLNRAISATQENKDDARERTVFEKFTEFNEQLFWLVQQKDYQKATACFDGKNQQRTTE
jgi:hypothetical protein